MMQNEFLSIQLAKPNQSNLVNLFFESHLQKDNLAIYSEEFLCKYGVSGAIRRKSIIISCVGKKIVGACRFYRKKDGNVSLYQFAIDEEFRGQGLLSLMLKRLGHTQVNVMCPTGIIFNDYYRKTGWSLKSTSEYYSQWVVMTKDFPPNEEV